MTEVERGIKIADEARRSGYRVIFGDGGSFEYVPMNSIPAVKVAEKIKSSGVESLLGKGVDKSNIYDAKEEDYSKPYISDFSPKDYRLISDLNLKLKYVKEDIKQINKKSRIISNRGDIASNNYLNKETHNVDLNDIAAGIMLLFNTRLKETNYFNKDKILNLFADCMVGKYSYVDSLGSKKVVEYTSCNCGGLYTATTVAALMPVVMRELLQHNIWKVKDSMASTVSIVTLCGCSAIRRSTIEKSNNNNNKGTLLYTSNGGSFSASELTKFFTDMTPKQWNKVPDDTVVEFNKAKDVFVSSDSLGFDIKPFFKFPK